MSPAWRPHLAETLAHEPFVTTAVAEGDPPAKLQPYAQTVMYTAEVDFVTIMDRDRIRYTHPDPEQLGKPYFGSIDEALTGHSQTEEYVGTLGPSVRAIVPIEGADGEVTAMVAVGVTLETLSVAQAASLPQIIIVALAAIALGGLGSWLLARYLRRAPSATDPRSSDGYPQPLVIAHQRRHQGVERQGIHPGPPGSSRPKRSRPKQTGSPSSVTGRRPMPTVGPRSPSTSTATESPG